MKRPHIVEAIDLAYVRCVQSVVGADETGNIWSHIWLHVVPTACVGAERRYVEGVVHDAWN